MSKVDRTKWPATYELHAIGGKAILPRDFFPTCCPGQLDEAWAARTVHFRPYFEAAAVQSGIVDANHECGENNRDNVSQWLVTVKRKILGKKYRNTMKSGWNKAMEELTNESNGDVDLSSMHPNFAFRGRRPITQSDVTSILFGSDVTNLVKSGELDQPMALLFMWGYYLTMEGCSKKWEKETTMQYIEDENWNVILGNECVGEKSMSVHSWVRVGAKAAVNSFQTHLRIQQKKCWGVTFESSLKINEGASSDEKSDLKIVDIGEYLPVKVKSDIMRINNTKFMVKRLREEKIDRGELMRMKVSNLYGWADQELISHEEIYKVMTEMKNKKTGAEILMTLGKRYEPSIGENDREFSKQYNGMNANVTTAMHPSATMAGRMRPPWMGTKLFDENEMNTLRKVPEKKKDNAVRTKAALTDYLGKSKDVSVSLFIMN